MRRALASPSALVAALALLAALAVPPRASAQNARRAAPVFEGVFASYGISCDCDPVDYVFLTRRAIAGRAQPSGRGPVVRTVEAGRRIEGNDFDHAIEVVRRAGVAVARRTFTLPDATDLGRIRYLPPNSSFQNIHALTVARGARIERLGGNGEGGEFVRYRGVVYFIDGGLSDDDVHTRSQPEVVVYLHLVARAGKPAAWIEASWGDASDTRPGVNLTELASTHS